MIGGVEVNLYSEKKCIYVSVFKTINQTTIFNLLFI